MSTHDAGWRSSLSMSVEASSLRIMSRAMPAAAARRQISATGKITGVAKATWLITISRVWSVPLAALLVLFLVVQGTYRLIERIFLTASALYAVYARSGRHPRVKERPEEPTLPVKPSRRGGLGAHTIVDYLMDRLGEMTDLERMSHDLSISKSYLIRRTRALTGHTVQSLHERLKMERACALLETQTLKVAEIASQLGYQTQSYFSAVFKKRTGVSPKEWVRRRN